MIPITCMIPIIEVITPNIPTFFAGKPPFQ